MVKVLGLQERARGAVISGKGEREIVKLRCPFHLVRHAAAGEGVLTPVTLLMLLRTVANGSAEAASEGRWPRARTPQVTSGALHRCAIQFGDDLQRRSCTHIVAASPDVLSFCTPFVCNHKFLEACSNNLSGECRRKRNHRIGMQSVFTAKSSPCMRSSPKPLELAPNPLTV